MYLKEEKNNNNKTVSLTAQPKNLHVLVRTLKLTHAHKCFYTVHISVNCKIESAIGMGYGIIYKYD